MTPFEIIIVCFIYLFCYGYIITILAKEENIWVKILLAIMSLVLVIYVPALIGSAIFEKLNNKRL